MWQCTGNDPSASNRNEKENRFRRKTISIFYNFRRYFGVICVYFYGNSYFESVWKRSNFFLLTLCSLFTLWSFLSVTLTVQSQFQWTWKEQKIVKGMPQLHFLVPTSTDWNFRFAIYIREGMCQKYPDDTLHIIRIWGSLTYCIRQIFKYLADFFPDRSGLILAEVEKIVFSDCMLVMISSRSIYAILCRLECSQKIAAKSNKYFQCIS